MIDSRVRTGLMWALLAVFLWSFTLPVTKVAIQAFPPVLTATGRAVIAGLLAALFLAIRRVPFPPRQSWRSLAFVVAGSVFGWPVLLAIALTQTTASHAAVIAAFLPMAGAMFAVLWTHETVSRTFWLAVIVGTGAVVAFSLSRGGMQSGSLWADALLVVAVLAGSAAYVWGADATKSMPGWQVISWAVTLSLPITIPVSAVLWLIHANSPAFVSATPPQWGALVFLGVSSMYLGFFAWYRGLAQAGVAYGMQVQHLQVLFTLVWSVWLLGESITIVTVVSALVVIGAVAWAQLTRGSKAGTTQPIQLALFRDGGGRGSPH